MIRKIWWVIHALIAMLVAVLVANYFYDKGHGLPLMGHDLPWWVYQIVLVGVFAVPAFWAVLHVMGGIFFGLAAGGLLDGLRLGLILGFGMALARCWPFCFASGIGIWAGGGPLLYILGMLLLGVVLFGLDRALVFFWTSTAKGHLEDN